MKSAWDVLTGKRRRRRVMAGLLLLTGLKALVIMAVYLRSLEYENRGYLFFPNKVAVAPSSPDNYSEPVKKEEPTLKKKGPDLDKLKEELSTTIEEYSRIKKEIEHKARPGP